MPHSKKLKEFVILASSTMSVEETINRYIEHLIHKLYIFKECVELEEGNCIDETLTITSVLLVPRKITDKTMTDLTRDILTTFVCYDIIDTAFEKRLTEAQSVDIYNNYKSYKQNERSKREQETTESNCCGEFLEPDYTLDTSDTVYKFSLDKITTKNLVSVFGEPVQTGTVQDKHRFEFKFRYGEHIFSLYDWKNDQNQFYDYNDIYWHVAANTNSKSILTAFKQCLQQKTTLI